MNKWKVKKGEKKRGLDKDKEWRRVETKWKERNGKIAVTDLFLCGGLWWFIVHVFLSLGPHEASLSISQNMYCTAHCETQTHRERGWIAMDRCERGGPKRHAASSMCAQCCLHRLSETLPTTSTKNYPKMYFPWLLNSQEAVCSVKVRGPDLFYSFFQDEKFWLVRIDNRKSICISNGLVISSVPSNSWQRASQHLETEADSFYYLPVVISLWHVNMSDVGKRPVNHALQFCKFCKLGYLKSFGYL